MNYIKEEVIESFLLKIHNTSIKRYLTLNELKEQYLSIINDSAVVKNSFFKTNIQSIEHRFEDFGRWLEAKFSENEFEIFHDYFEDDDVLEETSFLKSELSINEEIDVMLFVNDENNSIPEKIELFYMMCEMYNDESMLRFKNIFKSSDFMNKNKVEFCRIMQEGIEFSEKELEKTSD